MTRLRFLLLPAVSVVAAALLSAPGGRADDAGTASVAPEEPRVVPITAKRFEFTPNEVTLKKGETVVLRLTSEDVTHGFFSRKLKIDTDIPPHRETDVTVTAAAPGRYTVICSHFCGSGHGGMKMTVVVE